MLKTSSCLVKNQHGPTSLRSSKGNGSWDKQPHFVPAGSSGFPEVEANIPSFCLRVCTCVCVCVHTMCSVMSKSFQPHGLKPARLLCPWYWKNENWVKMKVTQLCLTLCDHMDYMVHGILQARILEWVPFLFTKGSSQPRDRTQVSRTGGGFLTNWAIRE